MNANRRRPREIVSQPLDAVETEQAPILLPAAGSDAGAEAPLAQAAVAPQAPAIEAPAPTSDHPTIGTQDAADELDESLIEEIVDGVEAVEDEAEELIENLHERIKHFEADNQVSEPNWHSVQARLKSSALYPLATETPKRGERLSGGISGANRLTASQTLVIRLDVIPFDSEVFDKAADARIRDLEHDHEGNEIKLKEKEKAARSLWIEKRDRKGHLETALSITLIDENQDTPADVLKKQLKAVATTFAHSYVNAKYQGMVWEECHPVDALSGRLLPTKAPRVKNGSLPTDRMILDSTECAALFHVPDNNFTADGVRPDRSRLIKLRPAHPLPTMVTLDHPTDNRIVWGIEGKGSTNERIVGNDLEQENQHVLVTGQTGTGKSQLAMMRFYCAACAMNGSKPQAAFMMDPHGQLAIGAAARVITGAPERIPDLIMLDAGDPTHSMVWNPLAIEHSPVVDDRDQIEGAVDATLRLVEPFAFQRGNAPAALALARLLFQALAEANLYMQDYKLSPFEAVPFLTDAKFRFRVVSLCSNNAVDVEFGPDGTYTTDEKRQAERAAVILRVFNNELQGIKAYRRMLGSGVNKLNIPRLMQENRLAIFTAARFGSDEQFGEILSGMITFDLLRSIKSWGRITDPRTGQIKDGGGIIIGDEAPTWVDEYIAVALAEARKFNVGIELYAQFLSQFGERSQKILSNVTGNTATQATLRLNPKKTDGMEVMIAPEGELKASDLAVLPNYHCYSNVLLAGGEKTGPIVTTNPPPLDSRVLHSKAFADGYEHVVSRSREELSLPITELDALWEQRQERTVLNNELQAALSRIGGTRNPTFKRMAEDDQQEKTINDISDQIENSDPTAWQQGDGWHQLDAQSDVADPADAAPELVESEPPAASAAPVAPTPDPFAPVDGNTAADQKEQS